jgi:hypothetical protein
MIFSRLIKINLRSGMVLQKMSRGDLRSPLVKEGWREVFNFITFWYSIGQSCPY